MAETIQSGIKFGTIYKDGGVRLSDTIIQSSWNPEAGYPSDDNYPLVNAVDIDWNGAEVDENKVINTTGELLSWIKEGLAAAAQSGGSVELTEEQIATIETCSNLLEFIKDYALRTADADKRYQAKGDYVLASVYTENKAAIDAAIEALQQAANGITEERIATIESNLSIATTALLSKVDEARVNAIIDAKGYQTETQVNAKIQAVIGAAPEALDTLKEIADKLADNDDIVASLTNQIAGKADAADFEEFVEEVNNANETTAEALVQLQENINNIQLTPGATGPQGPKGDTGAAGEAGIKGDTGATGTDGKSAYELYRETVVEKEAQPAIYAFESFNNAAKEVKYGEGQAKVIEMRAGGATIEVISNNSTDPNAADFVGQQFNIATALATNDPIQLYTLENNPVDIWVTVELVSEAQEAVVAMTQSEWLASLKGADGAQGAQGEQGPKGDTGTFDASALEDYATKTYVSEAIADVIGAAPETLNTLEEIAAKLQEVEGITGIKGDTGATGAQGPKGDTGATGAQGPKGDTGATGAQGEQGIQGPKGDTGEAGAKGDTGATGAKGDTGATGPKGDTGATGPQGPKGDTGTFDASALEDYATKTYVSEAIGGLTPETIAQLQEIVDSGITGTIGPKGDTGDTGAKGDTGDTGATGPKGDTGTFDSSTLESYATKTYVSEEIGKVVGEAPETLDTLKEIADALNDNATMTQVSEAISTKANSADVYTKTEIDAKVGNLGNASEAEGTEGETGYVPAVPHTVKSYVDALEAEVISNERVTSAAVNELNSSKANSADVYTKTEVNALLNNVSVDLTGYATETYIGEKIGDLGNVSEAVDDTPAVPHTVKSYVDAAVAGVDVSSQLTNYATNESVNSKIGTFGNKVEAVEAQDAVLYANAAEYNTAKGTSLTDEEFEALDNSEKIKTPAVEAVEAVPYTNVMEVITDNEEVTAAALTDLQAKYEALLARVVALEGATGATGA